jgi:putative AdoMet-dependent methyltransferase
MSDPGRAEIFDRWAEHYDRSVQSGSGLHEGYGEVLDLVVRSAEARPGMRVLDLGAGTGNLAQRFLARGCEVWGTDFSPAMLAKARVKLPQAKLVHMNLLADDWPEGLAGQRFDRIVSTYVFHEFALATKISLLTRLTAHHLTPGGWIVIGDVAFPDREALARAGADHWDEDEAYWAADEALAACAAAGLRATYTQVSRCGGVFVVQPTPEPRSSV